MAFGYPAYPGVYQPQVYPQMGQPQNQMMQGQQYLVQNQTQQTNTSMMTPPTIHAEIVQIDGGEAEATKYPVGVGMSQMMMAKDDSAIFIKTATANGYTLDIFDKRPPAPQPAPFNPDEYVRISALPEIVAAEVQAALAAMQPAKPTRKKNETEAAE